MRFVAFCALAGLVAAGCTSDPDREPSPGVVPSDAGVSADASQVDGSQLDSGASGFPDATHVEDDAGVTVDAGPGPDPIVGGTTVMLGGDRPAPLRVPRDYDGTAAMPLIILLHGYQVDAATQDFYFGMSRAADNHGYLLILPDGTREASEDRFRFWNAMPESCCNFYGSQVDDVGYLRGLLGEARALVQVDPDRVYFVGHSNGGFMSYRMACEIADEVAAIVSLAGSTFSDEISCDATEPVSVLQIHGTDDTTIPYDGFRMGTFGFPGAEETVQRWANRAGCNADATETGVMINIDAMLPGDETQVTNYKAGCVPDHEVSLWRIDGGGHIPNLVPGFADLIVDWMFAHPRN